MNYDNVVNLKYDVREMATSYGFGRLLPLLDVAVGIGTTTVRDQYKLAVRLYGVGLLHLRFKAAVRMLAKDAELDIVTTPPVRIIGGCSARGPRNTAPLRIGASIGFHAAGGGTVGFFARRRSDDALGVVSNNHVLAVQDRGAAGDPIIHPSRCDGGTQTVARLDDRYPRLAGGQLKQVDAAFAVLEPGVSPDTSSLGEDGVLDPNPALPRDDDQVVKIGRTTGRQVGRIRAFDFDRLVVKSYRFGIGKVKFENQVEIETTTRESFSNPGDSGSLVYNAARRPVGLLFAETAIGGARNLGLHYANPIDAVLSQLGLREIEA